MARCKSCNAPIHWVLTSTGKRMPLDVAKAEDGKGNLQATHFDYAIGMPTVVQVVKAGEGDWISHFATCPNSKQHRRR